MPTDTVTPEPTGPEPHGTGQQQPQGTDQPQGTNGTGEPHGTPDLDQWKREARKWEQTAKRNRDQLDALRKQVEGLVTPDKVEDVNQRLATVQQELEAARLDATRYRVALAQGLPADLAPRLQGSTEDEMVADAQTLKAFIRPTRGTPDAASGTAPNSEPTAMTADQALRAALGMATN